MVEGNEEKMKYFVWGLQRSGTNFMEQLIAKNFGGTKINRAHKCWKHSIDIPKGFDDKHQCFIIYKNPYTWVESLCFRNNVDWIKTQHTYPVKHNKRPRMQAGNGKFDVVALAQTYKHWHNTWTVNPPKKNLIIRYEDLLVEETRNEVLMLMNNKFGGVKKGSFVIPQKGKVSQSRDYSDSREQYYINMKPKHLTTEQIHAVTDTLGTDLFNKIGYTPL